MNKSPTVSVVMPAYNAETYLREAIDSILAQTYTDFEFIIINDGSTDRTKEIIQSYTDPRIVYLENEKNSGICVTLNKGLDAARGRYIARMDADDISMPHRLATQVAFMDSHPEIGVTGTHMQLMDENGKPRQVFMNSTDPYACYVDLLFGASVGHPTVMMRKSILTDHNLEYEDYFRGMEDYYLWWELARHTRISNIPQTLLHYRCHGGQVTKNQVNEDFLRRQREFLEIRIHDMNVNLSSREVDLMELYMRGIDRFDDCALTDFIGALKSLFDQFTTRNPEYKAPLRLYVAKAVSFVMDRSERNLANTKMHYTNMAFRKGCMPFGWWCKRTYHYIFG